MEIILWIVLGIIAVALAVVGAVVGVIVLLFLGSFLLGVGALFFAFVGAVMVLVSPLLLLTGDGTAALSVFGGAVLSFALAGLLFLVSRGGIWALDRIGVSLGESWSERRGR